MYMKTLFATMVACIVIIVFASTRLQAFELVIDGDEETAKGFAFTVRLDGEPVDVKQEDLVQEILRLEGEDLRESEDEIVRTLDSIAKGSGIAAGFADLALSNAQVEAKCLQEGEFAEPPLPVFLIKSKMRLLINPDLDAGHLDIWTKKKVICNINNQPVEQIFTRRWVITILNGGIIGQNITDDDYVYRLYSVGIPIRVVAYYEDGKLVKRLDADGYPDPRYRFYGVTNEACINIKLKIVPPNDGTIVSIPPSHLFFCAGGCGIPGVDATM